MGRGPGAKMRRARVPHVAGARVARQVCRVGEDGVRVVGGGIVLRHAVVGLMGRRLM